MADNVYQHGVVISITGIGELTGYSRESTGNHITAIGHEGHTVAEAMVDLKLAATIDALYVVGTTPPVAGDIISIGGVSYRVLSCKTTEAAADYTKVSISAVRFVSKSLPAAGS